MEIAKGKRILIVGASSDLGIALVKILLASSVKIGLHCFTNPQVFDFVSKKKNLAKTKIFNADISSQQASLKLIDAFVAWAGGIDCLIQLSGNVTNPISWDLLEQKDWDKDIAINLTGPFFLAQQAMKHMNKDGGKIIFTSTASVPHGGGKTSIAYGASKAAIEFLTKGLAREGAKNNILVNAVAPGFIMTKFHTQRMKRTVKDLQHRASLVPLRRAGEPNDIAGMMVYLLSPLGDYITGQIITISGGDWL